MFVTHDSTNITRRCFQMWIQKQSSLATFNHFLIWRVTRKCRNDIRKATISQQLLTFFAQNSVQNFHFVENLGMSSFFNKIPYSLLIATIEVMLLCTQDKYTIIFTSALLFNGDSLSTNSIKNEPEPFF